MKKLNTRTFVRSLSTLLVIVAGSPMAATHDYFVHTEPYNPNGFQQQPWSITVDWLGGNELTPPDDACGMRFEGDWLLKWHSDAYGLVDNIPADGEADVWLPQPGCGAWSSVVVEPAGGPLYSPPYDFAGYIQVYGKGYWINANGEKLVYLHQPCHPMPECILGPQGFVRNGWSDGMGYPIQQIKFAVDLLDSRTSKAIVQIERATDAVDKAAEQLKYQLEQRRRYDTGSLERSIRQLEDAASRNVAEARRALAECSAAVEVGDSETTNRACNTALLKMQTARTVLDTGDAWVE